MKSKNLSRRDFLRVSALAAAGLVAAQCQAAPPATEAPKAEATKAPEATATPVPAPTATEAPKEAVKIVWWGESGDAQQMEWLKKNFIDSFNSAHKDIQIDYVFQEDLDRVLRTAVQAGAGPDILITPGAGFVLEYVIAGYPLPMDDFAVKYGWKDKLLGWAYESGMVQGKLLSLIHI